LTEVITDADAAGARAAAAGTDDEFRKALRSWLTDNHPGKRPKDPGERQVWQKAWLAKLYDAGFAGPSWPRAYGGMDLPFARQIIYQEEYASARVPGPLGTGLGIVGPTLITYGTDEQKRRFLPSMLRGDTVWAQGFSEPEAGSDLPALRATARRDGDEYVVNGQKVWNTSADIADILFTLVRTGSRESRARGITYLLIDAHAPGVTIRPLRDLTGGADFSEIFFEGATADPLVRDRLADFEIRVRIMRYQGMRTIESILAKGEPGPGASTSRLFITAFEQDLHEFAVDLLGSYGTLGRTDVHSVERGRWVWGFLRTRASTIGTGTSEIQRNTIAEQVLGLPYDPAMPPR